MLLTYMEMIVCDFFLNNEVPHKNWAVLLKYSFLKKHSFLSVDIYDWKILLAQILEREMERCAIFLEKEVVD